MPRPHTDARHELGRSGEEQAASYLESAGYRILARNFRAGRIEVDLVCLAPPSPPLGVRTEIVFVEVKCRRGPGTARPEEAVGSAKQKRLVHAAAAYLFQHRIEGLYPRFDVIAIEVTPSGNSLRHIQAAFWAER